MNAWEKNVRKVTPYTPGEQPKVDDVIKLNTNECPYPPSPKVVEALENMNKDKLRLYPDPDATELVDAIAEYYNVNSNQVFVGVGSDDVIGMAFLTFFNSDKPILFPDITYSFYDVWADLFKIKYETKKLDDNFNIKVEDYFEPNGGVIFPNPNAPTSIEISLDSIEEIIKNNQDVVVIVDEAYADFGKVTALDLVNKYNNLDFKVGDISFFDNYNSNSFDGIILSNVLDVMPKDVALKTFKRLTDLLAPKGLMFVKLNPYYEKSDMKAWGFTQINDNLFEENGVLRYRELDTASWKQSFEKHYEIIRYLEFPYPWQDGMNRLFLLQKKL